MKPPFVYACPKPDHHHRHHLHHPNDQRLQNDPAQNVAQLSIASTFVWRVPPPRPPPELQHPPAETQHPPATVSADTAGTGGAARVSPAVEGGGRTDDEEEREEKEKEKDGGQVELLPEKRATTASFRYVKRTGSSGSSSDGSSGDRQGKQYELQGTPGLTSPSPAPTVAQAPALAPTPAPALSSVMISQQQQQKPQLPYYPPPRPQRQPKPRPPPTAGLRVSRRDGMLLGKMQKGITKRPLNANTTASMRLQGHSAIDIGVGSPPSASVYAVAHTERERRRERERYGQTARERKRHAEVIARLSRLEKVLVVGDNVNGNRLKKKKTNKKNTHDHRNDDDDDDDDNDDDDDEHQINNNSNNNNHSHEQSESRSESRSGSRSMPISKPTSVEMKAMVETMMGGLQNEVAMMKGSIDQLVTLVLKLHCRKTATDGAGVAPSAAGTDMRLLSNTGGGGVSDAAAIIVPNETKKNTENNNSNDDDGDVQRLLKELKERLDSMSAQLRAYERDKVVPQMADYKRVCSVLNKVVRQTDDSLITAVSSLIALARPGLADALASAMAHSQPQRLQQPLQPPPQQLQLQQPAENEHHEEQQQKELQQQRRKRLQLHNNEDNDGHNDVGDDWWAEEQRTPPPQLQRMPRTAREAKEWRKAPVMLRLRLRRKTEKKKDKEKGQASRWGSGPQVIVMKRTMVGKPVKKRTMALCRPQQQGLQC